MVTSYIALLVEEHVDREENDNEYGRGNTFTTRDINGVEIVDSHQYHGLSFDYKIKPGDVLHCVVAEYSTGDSFGRDDNAACDFVMAFKDHALAKAAVDACNDTPEDDLVKFKLDNGNEMMYHRPWIGYFEHLDKLEIHTFVVQERYKKRR